MEVMSLFNADTCPKSEVDPQRDLTSFPELLEHIKRKNPIYDNYYEAKDIIMKIMEEKEDIMAAVIQRKGTKCVIYFRKRQREETTKDCYIRFVDNTRHTKNKDLFIKIAV